MSGWSVQPEPASSDAARMLWREYYTEMSDRWFQVNEGIERTPPGDLARGLTTDDADTLTPPAGIYLLGRLDGRVAGGIGVRKINGTTAELKRLFIRRQFRGHGGGPVLLNAAEQVARDFGSDRLVLDTRSDLVEARRLYLRHGYIDTPAHNAAAYSDRWMAKDLDGRAADPKSHTYAGPTR